MRSPIQLLHGRVFQRRVRVLSERIAALLPQNASVLDVGCGDGEIAARIMSIRPDVNMTGVDVLVRPITHIPVLQFDGTRIPSGDASYDAALLIDVVHHAAHPEVLLGEVARVTRSAVVIKDHLADRMGARLVLRAMDWVGNARHGVRLPYNYWTLEQWRGAARQAGLRVTSWSGEIPLYPPPASVIFGWRLHFLAVLTPIGRFAAPDVIDQRSVPSAGRP